MAEIVFQYTATIPAGTPEASPVTVSLPFDGYDVEQIDLEVPAGPNGLMGFYLDNNGVPWIPRASDTWIIWDDNSQTYYTTDYPNASGWNIVGYNAGTYDHSVVVRFHCIPLPSAAAAVGDFLTAFIDAQATDAETLIL